MIRLSDVHKQKLWADFLAWSGGKNFYEVPLFGHGSEIGVDDFLQAHAGISGWLNTLPKYMHASVLEWVDHLQRNHLKRDEEMQKTYSRDHMFEKVWTDGYPKDFRRLPAMASEGMGFVGLVFYHPALTQAQCAIVNFLKLPASSVIADLNLPMASGKHSLPATAEPMKFLATGLAMEFGKKHDYISLKLRPGSQYREVSAALGKATPKYTMLRLLQAPKGSISRAKFPKIQFAPIEIVSSGLGKWDQLGRILHETTASDSSTCCLCAESIEDACRCDCHQEITEMAKSDVINLKRKAKYLSMLMEELEHRGLPVPAWAQNKLSAAKNQISDVMDYVAALVEKHSAEASSDDDVVYETEMDGRSILIKEISWDPNMPEKTDIVWAVYKDSDDELNEQQLSELNKEEFDHLCDLWSERYGRGGSHAH